MPTREEVLADMAKWIHVGDGNFVYPDGTPVPPTKVVTGPLDVDEKSADWIRGAAEKMAKEDAELFSKD